MQPMSTRQTAVLEGNLAYKMYNIPTVGSLSTAKSKFYFTFFFFFTLKDFCSLRYIYY